MSSYMYDLSWNAWYWLFPYVQINVYPHALIQMSSIGSAGSQCRLLGMRHWNKGVVEIPSKSRLNQNEKSLLRN